MTTQEMLDEAKSLYAANRFDESELAFTQLLSGRPPKALKAEALYGLGLISLSRNDLQGAAHNLQFSLEANPSNVHALFCLGQIAEREGKRGEAVARYGQALSVNPRSRGPLDAMTRLTGGEPARAPGRPTPPPNERFATWPRPADPYGFDRPATPETQPFTDFVVPRNQRDLDEYRDWAIRKGRAEWGIQWRSTPVAIRIFQVAFTAFVFGFIAFGFYQGFTHWGP